jgi:hemolysin III
MMAVMTGSSTTHDNPMFDGGDEFNRASAVRAAAPPGAEQTAGEEWASGLVHALGAGLAVAGLGAMVVATGGVGPPLRVGTLIVFGVCMVAVYSASALLHLVPPPRFQRVLLACDHIAIYLLIAGTYTPLMLSAVGGFWGGLVFALVWGLSLTGIGLRLALGEGLAGLHLAMYLTAGWAGVVGAGPIVAALNPTTLVVLLIGGVFYTGGVVFFLWRRLRFNHALWHGCVLVGTACHFLAIWDELVSGV